MTKASSEVFVSSTPSGVVVVVLLQALLKRSVPTLRMCRSVLKFLLYVWDVNSLGLRGGSEAIDRLSLFAF